jgi:hypothetical protein
LATPKVLPPFYFVAGALAMLAPLLAFLPGLRGFPYLSFLGLLPKLIGPVYAS